MKRGRVEIWMDIIVAIRAQTQQGDGTPKPSRVRAAANVPTARFNTHLAALEERGLVKREPLSVTAQGHAFVRQALPVRGFVEEPAPDEDDGTALG